MDSYTLTIYRIENEQQVIGTLQHLAEPVNYRFKSMQELWQLLNRYSSENLNSPISGTANSTVPVLRVINGAGEE